MNLNVKEELLEEHYCKSCDVQVYYKVTQSRLVLSYPKVFTFITNENSICEIENSFIVKDYTSNIIVYKPYSVIKQSTTLFLSQVKYEDDSIIEFRLDEPVLIYKSDVFNMSKDTQYKLLFYYDINFGIND